MICGNCGRENPDNAWTCAGCNRPLTAPAQGQQGWGSAPQGWGAPQQGYGPGPQASWGVQPAYGYGAMVQAGPKGTTRNPVTVLILSFFCCYGFFIAWIMLNELQAYTQDESFKPWKIMIPFYNLYFWHSEVPDQVSKAKRMAGCRNPYANGFYEHANVALYSLAKDLNEIWDPQGMGR